MKGLLFGTIFSLLSVNVYALTINEAINNALQNDNTIKSQEQTVKARNLEDGFAFLIFFPSIQATYNYTYAEDDYTSAGRGMSFGDSSSLGASANLNVFNGLYDISISQIAGLTADSAEFQLTTVNYDTVLNAQTAYINVLRANKELELAMQNLELLNLQLRDAKLSADNGLIALNDLLEVETFVASAELQRISAESNVVLARKQLEKVMNVMLEDGTTFVDPELILLKDINYDNLEELMFNNRSDLKQLDTNYKISEKNELVAMSNLYPKINVNVGYNTYGNEISPFVGNPDFKDTGFTTGVTATWNIVSATASVVDFITSNYDTRAVSYTIKDVRQNMQLSLSTALQTYNTSQAQLAQSSIAVRSAEENYRVTNNLYQQDMATMTDLLDASVLLNQAKLTQTSATYGVLSSIYQIERMIEIPIEQIEKN